MYVEREKKKVVDQNELTLLSFFFLLAFPLRYFTRTILQFQFWESLCSISGHRGPLHRCDFSGSKEAGAALGKMLR